MKHPILILCILCASLFSYGQIYSIHPLVGDTINTSENQSFNLFDEPIIEAYVLVADNDYVITKVISKDSTISHCISNLELNELSLKVERTIAFRELSAPNIQEPIDLKVNDPGYKKNLDAEYKEKYWHDKNKAMQKQINEGTWVPQLQMEIDLKRKNKKP